MVVVGTETTSKSVIISTGTSHGTTSTTNGGGVSTTVSASEAQGERMRFHVEGVIVGLLGVFGFVAGLY
jgi:hypothetical protein